MAAWHSRERRVEAFRHRTSGRLLLFPWAGVLPLQAPAADAVLLPMDFSPVILGEEVRRLLAAGRAMDLTQRVRGSPDFLRSLPRTPTPGVDSEWDAPLGRTWREFLSIFPALLQGAAAILRQFEVVEIRERETWIHRVFARLDRSPRGELAEIGKQRQALCATPRELGELIVEMLAIGTRTSQAPAPVFRRRRL